MATTNPILTEFPPVTTAEWEAVITKDLKGQDYAKRLLWNTDEGITVKPYYRAEDIAPLGALAPLARGAWRVVERVGGATVEAANQAARKALNNGAEDICFSFVPATAGALSALLDGLPLGKCGLHFAAGAQAPALLPLLAGLARTAPLKGTVDLAVADVAACAATITALRQSAPEFRTVKIDAGRFAEAGGTSVQELGYGLAEAVDAIEKLVAAGVSAADAAGTLYFSFATGANYFFEIAKPRAARLLWARIAEGYGVTVPAMIASRTSHWTKTVYDPWVNLLRTTTEAMSAGLGGSDCVYVEPFDSTFKEAGEDSLRLARNTQIVLKQEASLDRVADPAAGSYYLEVLTDSLARAAWKLFQEVEAAGGFAKATETINQAIAKSRAAKEAAVASRRRTVLGTNQYPNRKETMLDKIERKDTAPRAACAFEAIRLRTERFVAAGNVNPKFLLLEMGDLKMRKARSGFVSNFFGCAGFDIAIETAADTDAARKLAADQKAAVVVLCSSDDEYAALVEGIKGLTVPVIVAGNPKDAEALKAAGVAEFVHVRSNAVQVLTAWQDKLGVKA